MGRHRPAPPARRYAERVAWSIGSDIANARTTLVMSVEQIARRAQVAPSTVLRVLRGDPGVHLDTLCAVGFAVGVRISLKGYPAAGPGLRDTGQLTVAQYLIDQAHPTWSPALEHPVGDPFGRAADLVLFGPTEILHHEIERRLNDLQDQARSGKVKRDALQSTHARPVRFVLVVEDTERNRRLAAPHAHLLRSAFPATSADVFRSLRSGTPLGRDGLLWVRPWRSHPKPVPPP